MRDLKQIDIEYRNAHYDYEQSEIELAEYMENAFNYQFDDFDHWTISIIVVCLEMAFKKCFELKSEALEYLANNNHSL